MPSAIPASPSELLAISLLFFGAVLPLSMVAGGALFVPMERSYWLPSVLAARIQRHRMPLALFFATILAAVLEAQVDAVTTSWVVDMTPRLVPLEGELTAPLQVFQPWWFRLPVAVCYVFGFPFLVYFSPLLYVWLDEQRLVWRAVAAYAFCFLAALPFYLFMPVDEAWTRGHVQNLAVFHPSIEGLLYAFNLINNSFPSLHTAISVSLAYVAWRSGNRRYARFAVGLATVIVFSTLYLGIHWFTDVVAGLLLAVLVCRLVDVWLPRGPQVHDSMPLPNSAR